MNLKHLLEKIVKTAYIDEEVLKSAPSKIKGKFELFTVGKYISDDDLQKDYESEVPMYQTAEQVINLLNSNKNATIEDMYFILFHNKIVKHEELDVLKEWLRIIRE